jgi:hypothetical protein
MSAKMRCVGILAAALFIGLLAMERMVRVAIDLGGLR